MDDTTAAARSAELAKCAPTYGAALSEAATKIDSDPARALLVLYVIVASLVAENPGLVGRKVRGHEITMDVRVEGREGGKP